MRNFERYCKNFEDIENYEKAKSNNFKGWQCHHRLETHTSDGERRLVDISKKELKALDMYYNRPSEELIFMIVGDHVRLHHKGAFRKPTFSESMKGKNNPMYGKHLSEEAKRKLSEANKGNQAFKGRHHSEETKRKLSEVTKGKHWKLVDGKRFYY